MNTQLGRRGLSAEFMQDLKSNGGPLNPLLSRVWSDKSLEIEIRQEYLNVYYRGGSLLRIARVKKGTGYTAYFNPKYGHGSVPTPLNLPGNRIVSAADMECWIARFPVLKNAMDLWFGRHPKDERASQQLVVHENNVSSWAGGTDYFMIDIEYDNHIGARFDLVALKWDSNAPARKLQGTDLPKLTAIEMKTGDGALKGSAGLLEHYEQWEKFFAQPTQLEAFKLEMLRVFDQKRKLGLIPALKNNRNVVEMVADDVDVVFLLANHDPASGKLKAAVDEIRARDELRKKQVKTPSRFNIRFATATFMGFGLYSENILSLADFGKQLDRIAKRPA